MMERLTRWLVARLVTDWRETQRPAVRTRYGVLEGWVGVVGNLVLGLVKLALGAALASVGLIADAVHSLSDMATSIVVLISFRVSRKPPDREHPFGHAKAEHVATLVVALLMIVAGYQLGESAILSWIGDAPTGALLPLTWPVFLVLLVLLASKEALAAFSRILGRMIDSPALEADGWHHRTDALSTGVVILGLAGRNVGLPWVDPLAGVLVAAWVIYTGFRLASDSVSPLLGEQVPQSTIDDIKTVVQSVEGVHSVHDLAVHRYGHYYFTTLHVELPDSMDVHHMHAITVRIETRVLRRYPGQCVVHMDPVNLNHPLLTRVQDTLRDVVVGTQELVEFRDLNLWSSDGREVGHVEVSVEPEVPEERYAALGSHVASEVNRRFPHLHLDVRLTVDFTATPLA